MGLGWGALLGKLSTFLPGRVERMKHERDRLWAEKLKLLQGKADEKKTGRMAWIVDRLRELDRMLAHKASD